MVFDRRRSPISLRTTPLSLFPSRPSVFRLAHLLELDSLVELALDQIKSNLTPDMIAYEVFSDISAAYPGFRAVVVHFAVRHWKKVKKSQAFRETQSRIRSGELVNMSEVMMELLRLVG